MEKSKVYFTSEITPENVVKLYEKLGKELSGKVAIAEDPCIKDIGILASIDPIAIDQACIDLVKNSNDEGKEHFLERVNSRNGTHTIDVANKLGFGSIEYELIKVD